MIAIKTIASIPDSCRDCVCHESGDFNCLGLCRAIRKDDGSYQEAQAIRPYNCPLVVVEKPAEEVTEND